MFKFIHSTMLSAAVVSFLAFFCCSCSYLQLPLAAHAVTLGVQLQRAPSWSSASKSRTTRQRKLFNRAGGGGAQGRRAPPASPPGCGQSGLSPRHAAWPTSHGGDEGIGDEEEDEVQMVLAPDRSSVASGFPFERRGGACASSSPQFGRSRRDMGQLSMPELAANLASVGLHVGKTKEHVAATRGDERRAVEEDDPAAHLQPGLPDIQEVLEEDGCAHKVCSAVLQAVSSSAGACAARGEQGSCSCARSRSSRTDSEDGANSASSGAGAASSPATSDEICGCCGGGGILDRRDHGRGRYEKSSCCPPECEYPPRFTYGSRRPPRQTRGFPLQYYSSGGSSSTFGSYGGYGVVSSFRMRQLLWEKRTTQSPTDAEVTLERVETGGDGDCLYSSILATFDMAREARRLLAAQLAASKAPRCSALAGASAATPIHDAVQGLAASISSGTTLTLPLSALSRALLRGGGSDSTRVAAAAAPAATLSLTPSTAASTLQPEDLQGAGNAVCFAQNEERNAEDGAEQHSDVESGALGLSSGALAVTRKLDEELGAFLSAQQMEELGAAPTSCLQLPGVPDTSLPSPPFSAQTQPDPERATCGNNFFFPQISSHVHGQAAQREGSTGVLSPEAATAGVRLPPRTARGLPPTPGAVDNMSFRSVRERLQERLAVRMFRLDHIDTEAVDALARKMRVYRRLEQERAEADEGGAEQSERANRGTIVLPDSGDVGGGGAEGAEPPQHDRPRAGPADDVSAPPPVIPQLSSCSSLTESCQSEGQGSRGESSSDGGGAGYAGQLVRGIRRAVTSLYSSSGLGGGGIVGSASARTSPVVAELFGGGGMAADYQALPAGEGGSASPPEAEVPAEPCGDAPRLFTRDFLPPTAAAAPCDQQSTTLPLPPFGDSLPSAATGSGDASAAASRIRNSTRFIGAGGAPLISSESRTSVSWWGQGSTRTTITTSSPYLALPLLKVEDGAATFGPSSTRTVTTTTAATSATPLSVEGTAGPEAAERVPFSPTLPMLPERNVSETESGPPAPPASIDAGGGLRPATPYTSSMWQPAPPFLSPPASPAPPPEIERGVILHDVDGQELQLVAEQVPTPAAQNHWPPRRPEKIPGHFCTARQPSLPPAPAAAQQQPPRNVNDNGPRDVSNRSDLSQMKSSVSSSGRPVKPQDLRDALTMLLRVRYRPGKSANSFSKAEYVSTYRRLRRREDFGYAREQEVRLAAELLNVAIVVYGPHYGFDEPWSWTLVGGKSFSTTIEDIAKDETMPYIPIFWNGMNHYQAMLPVVSDEEVEAEMKRLGVVAAGGRARGAAGSFPSSTYQNVGEERRSSTGSAGRARFSPGGSYLGRDEVGGQEPCSGVFRRKGPWQPDVKRSFAYDALEDEDCACFPGTSYCGFDFNTCWNAIDACVNDGKLCEFPRAVRSRDTEQESPTSNSPGADASRSPSDEDGNNGGQGDGDGGENEHGAAYAQGARIEIARCFDRWIGRCLRPNQRDGDYTEGGNNNTAGGGKMEIESRAGSSSGGSRARKGSAEFRE